MAAFLGARKSRCDFLSPVIALMDGGSEGLEFGQSLVGDGELGFMRAG